MRPEAGSSFSRGKTGREKQRKRNRAGHTSLGAPAGCLTDLEVACAQRCVSLQGAFICQRVCVCVPLLMEGKAQAGGGPLPSLPPSTDCSGTTSRGPAAAVGMGRTSLPPLTLVWQLWAGQEGYGRSIHTLVGPVTSGPRARGAEGWWQRCRPRGWKSSCRL